MDIVTSSADSERRRRVHEKLEREFGPLVMGALRDDSVVEVMVNPNGSIYVEQLGRQPQRVGTMQPQQAEAAISTVAALLKTIVDTENPYLECQLPLDGSRFSAWLPPETPAPAYVIRRRASKILTLDQYHADGVITATQLTTLRGLIASRRNIMVAGGTGSGKTTFLNAMIHEIVQQGVENNYIPRLVIMEDTPELQCAADNALFLHTSPGRTMQALSRTILRARPDRALVGEVRGGEILDLLKIWTTGHPGGLGTLHADSAAETPHRVEELVAEATTANKTRLIARAINAVVFIRKTVATEANPAARVVDGIVSVLGHDGHNYITEPLE